MVCNPIRDARTRLHLTREQLGEILGVSGRTVSYWETWKKVPDPERAALLRDKLGLSEVDLWRALHRASPKTPSIQKRRASIW